MPFQSKKNMTGVINRHSPPLSSLQNLHLERGLQLFVECLHSSLKTAVSLGVVQRTTINQPNIVIPPELGGLDHGVLSRSTITQIDKRKSVEDLTKFFEEGCADSTEGDVHKLKKVFIKNIHFKTSQHRLWDFMKFFGEVKYCTIQKNLFNKSRGIGYVHFTQASSAERLLNASSEELQLHGRTLFVEPVKAIDRNLTRKSMNHYEPENVHSEGLSDSSLSSAHQGDELHGTSIYKLNTDTLKHVFSFLSLKERILVERVCKHWQDVSRSTWLGLTHIGLESMTCGFQVFSDRNFQSIMKRVGLPLQSIDVSANARMLSDKSLGVIAQYAPNVTHLNLSNIRATNVGFKKLSQHCTQLQELILENCNNLGEDGIWWIFHKCKQLKQVNLKNNMRMNGKCFHVMPWALNKLVLNGCYKLKDLGLEKISLRSTDLRSLSINCCHQITDDGILKIIQGCPLLEELHLESLTEVSGFSLNEIGNLKYLKTLALAESPLNDEILFTISKNCSELRYLDISSCCGAISDGGIKHLARCIQLQYLDISLNYTVTDDALERLALHNSLLESLKLRGLENITNQGVVQIVRHCIRLRRLDISNCKQIDETALEEILLLKDSSSTHLAIAVAGTSMPSGLEANPSPSLTLEGTFLLGVSDPLDDIYDDLYYESDGNEGMSEDDWKEVDIESFSHDQDFQGMHFEASDDFLINDDPMAMDDWNIS